MLLLLCMALVRHDCGVRAPPPAIHVKTINLSDIVNKATGHAIVTSSAMTKVRRVQLLAWWHAVLSWRKWELLDQQKSSESYVHGLVACFRRAPQPDLGKDCVIDVI